MKYTFFLAAKPGAEPTYGADGWKSYAAAYGAWNEQAAKAGIHRGGEPVQPPESAATIRNEEGSVKLQSGPFIEAQEVIVGWYLIEVDNFDEAVKWASKIPLVDRGFGVVEIRPSIVFSQP